jgi:basic amino acid/polyamine antiporter, APA family
MEEATARVAPPVVGLRPGLGLFDATTLVAGSMIGSGIFIVAADIVRQVGSPAALLATWIVAGLMTIAGALAYGELAAMMPQAGGQYVYLREAYGGLWAFLFGWTLLLIIQTGTIAAVAVAFARFLGVLWPVLGTRVWLGAGSFGFSGERLGAIMVIAILTIANLRGLNMGRLVQNSFTTAKVLALVMIVLVGCVLFPNPAALRANFGTVHGFFFQGVPATGFLAVFGAAMVGALFSADAWASVTFAASEIRNPGRNLPRALALGSGAVIILYLLTNLAYLFQLPAAGVAHGSDVFARGIAHAASDRVASAAMEVVWGAAGASLTAVLVMISAFGCANGLILTGARVIYAMAEDGVFFAAARRLNAANVPAFALIVQGVWAALLAVSGTYSELLDYVIFAALFFYVLTVGAVFRLRRTRPEAPRPYRAWGYPIVPAAYMIAAAAIMIDLLVMQPRFSWPGVIIVLSGVPIYIVTRRRTSIVSARGRG